MTYQNHNKGFSTLELLIAFAVMTLGITAVIMVAFGNQSIAIDTELAQRALYISEQKLEEAGAIAHDPTEGIDSLEDETVNIGRYEATTSVSDDDCFKVVTSEVGWQRGLRDLNTKLTSIFGDPRKSEEQGGDCPTTPPGDEWDNPNSLNIDDVINAGNKATDVDVVEHPLGIFALLTSNHLMGANTYWVIDVTDIDNVDPSSVVGGFEADYDYNALDSYVDEASGNIYSFVATSSSTAPLQILETVFPPNYPYQPVTVTRTSVDLHITSPCPGPNPEFCAKALAIEYKDEKVYVGTHRTAGKEFQVFSETSPGTLNPIPYATKEIDHNINDLDVVGDWAYLATSDDSGEVIALNVSGPIIPYFDNTKFDAPGHDDSDGISIFSSSQYTYLGRVQDNHEPDFYLLRNEDIQDTASIEDGVVDAIDMDTTLCTRKNGATLTDTPCLNSNTKIEGITVWGNLAFLSTNSQHSEFQIWDVSDKNNIVPHIGCNAYEFPAKPTSIEFPGKLKYTGYPQGRELGFLSVDSNDALRVIYDPQIPDICTP